MIWLLHSARFCGAQERISIPAFRNLDRSSANSGAGFSLAKACEIRADANGDRIHRRCFSSSIVRRRRGNYGLIGLLLWQFIDSGAGGAAINVHNSGNSDFHGEFGILVSAKAAPRQLGSPKVSIVGSISKSNACVSHLSSIHFSGA